MCKNVVLSLSLFVCIHSFMFSTSILANEAAGSSSGDEDSDDPSTWKLSAYTRQKARKRGPAEKNFVTSDTSDSDDDPPSSSYGEGEREEEEGGGDVESLSESSEAGAAGFFDDEAMEASFSSELEEMEYEGSGESEVDGEEEGGGCDGFIVDEAEEEEEYQARRKRRRRRRGRMSLCSSGSSEGSEQSDKENDTTAVDEQNMNLNIKLQRRKVKNREQLLDDDATSDERSEEDGTAEREGERSSLEQHEEEERRENEVEFDELASTGDSFDDDLTNSDGEGLGEDEDGSAVEEEEKETPGHLKWKSDLLAKAREAYDMRNKRSMSLRKLVYSDLPLDHDEEKSSDDAEKQENGDSFELGGLFQLAKNKEALSLNHRDDTSIPATASHALSLSCDWSDSLIAPTVKSLFVTGSWGDQDAQALLDEDKEVYGDFEDLETGEKSEERKLAGASKDEGEALGEGETTEAKRLKKKKRLKAAFDVDYDDKEGEDGGYLEELKREVSEQERRNKEEFEGLDEQARVQYEGFRPGTYVRMELKGEILLSWHAHYCSMIINYVCITMYIVL